MVRIESHCVGCDTCAPYCELKEVLVYYCDICGEEIYHDEVQNRNDQDLCPSCVEMFYRKKGRRYYIEQRNEREVTHERHGTYLAQR